MKEKQVVVEGGGVVEGGVDKGGASAVYKMLIGLNLWKNPHFEKNGPTKLPSQMGHKGSEAVYRTFRPPAPPAHLPACTNCVFRKRQVGAEE